MKKFYFVLSLMVFATIFTVSAKNKVFYDSKSQLLGISGHYEALLENAKLEYKTFLNPVTLPDSFDLILPKDVKKGYNMTLEQDIVAVEQMTEQLNNAHFGKKVLDYLFEYDGKKLAINILQKRAAANAQFLDAEYAAVTIEGKDDLMGALTNDEYLKPIVKNNFIYVQKDINKDIFYAVFKVVMDDDILDKVYNCWENMDEYNNLDPQVTFVCARKVKKEKLLAHLSEDCPEFAIRGQLKSRNPATAFLGESSGASFGDRVLVYRQSIDNDGDMISKIISRGRINKNDDGTSQFYFIGGTKGSKEQGDMVVLSPDKRMGLTFEGNFGTTGWYGASFTADYLITTLKGSSLNVYGLLDIRADFSNKIKEGRKFNFNGHILEFTKPLILDGGLGIGVGYNLLGRLEFVPYVKAQAEFGAFMNKNHKNNNSIESADMSYMALRVPVGAKFNVNICYPVQLTFGVDYALMLGIFDFGVDKGYDATYDGKNNIINAKYDFVKKNVFEPNGIKRNNLNFHAGVRIFF